MQVAPASRAAWSASNPEMGGFGSINDGTLVCTYLQAGSHPDKSIARDMGRVAGVETAALGCNWTFAPVVDIYLNWRNTVVATRAFGNTPEVVIERNTNATAFRSVVSYLVAGN